MQSYALKGGLDLRTGLAMRSPGTLADCLNYTVSEQDGYTRIDGFARYDGQFHVAEFRAVRLTVTGTFRVGDKLTFGGATGYVTKVLSGAVAVVCHSRDPWPLTLPASLTNATRRTAGSVTALALLTAPQGLQKDVNTWHSALATTARALVGVVPGNPDMPVACTVWFKNRLYAIRDFPLVWFESAQNYPFRVGDAVTFAGGVFTIIELHYTTAAHESGYAVLWPVSAAGLPMTALPALGTALARSGTYTGFTLGGAALGELPLAVLGDLNYGNSKATVTGSGQGITGPRDTPSAYRTPAGLWKATSTGWQYVDLKREVAFNAGTAAFDTFIAANLSGTLPVTTTAYTSGAATLSGTDVTSDVASEDGTDAALPTTTTSELRVTGFDFSAIPDTADITGVTVKIKRHADAGSKVRDDSVELLGLDGTSSNKARMVAWDTTDTEVVYGASDDTWGNDNLTSAIVNDAGFGLRLTTQAIDTTPSGGIDAVLMAVSYRRRDAPVFAWTGASDIDVNLIDVQLINGNYSSNDAAGWLAVDIPSVVWASVLANGMQLRSAANGGGDLLATLAGADAAIRLPGWSDLERNGTQYECIVTNYKGTADGIAIFGVSGASPAFTYDGHRLLWVRTPLSPHDDLPAHIARHGASLALGYQSGAYILSAVGAPTDFRGVDEAASFEIGDTLTNLVPAMGDALLVTGQTKTMLLHGLSSTTYQQNTVADQRGALPYTGANIGRILAVDALGIVAADATPAFGDLTLSYVSMAVEAWLTPRLGATLGADSNALQPIRTLVVRRKNQYRTYFRDGYVLTMTSRNAPEFTLQRYTDGDTALPISTVCTGVDNNARERVYGSFDADGYRGYVMEFDHGASFDGQPMAAHITLNPLAFSKNMQLKRFDRLFLLGQATGFATLSVRRAIDYTLPDGTRPAWSLTFGPSDAAYGARGARGAVDAPIEGYEINIRVDATAVSEGPHVLQAIATAADARGDSRGQARN